MLDSAIGLSVPVQRSSRSFDLAPLVSLGLGSAGNSGPSFMPWPDFNADPGARVPTSEQSRLALALRYVADWRMEPEDDQPYLRWRLAPGRPGRYEVDQAGARMFEEPEITTCPEQDVASVRLCVPRAQITAVMGPGIQEIYATLRAQGIAPAGPWLTHHFRIDPATFDFEICVPVSRPVAEQGRVKPAKMRATRLVRALMRGDYPQLGTTWPAFLAWIDEQGLQKAGDVWEVYETGPESGPDPAHYRTWLNVALRD